MQSEAALAALAGERETHQAALEAARATLRAAGDKRHKLAMAQQQARTARDGLRERLARARAELERLAVRREAVARQIEEALAKEHAPQAELGRLLDERAAAQAALAAAEQDLDVREQALRRANGLRHDVDAATRAAEEEANKKKLRVHELKVRRDALLEGLRAQGVEEDIARIAEDLQEHVDIEPLERELADLVERVRRLGAVNLMAIEEFEEQSRRKEFLDAQHADLSEALALLDEAIRKIDRETRSRFKETFERVNEDFKAFFPRLFGGGEAQLLLSSEDLLETGVTVMARPPGKRNSTIQLLSGGEKALVAVSLIFALFALNPAPFCFLDEVDAPLDEANVGRFAQTLKELSKKSQLLFITHNKVTMEAADVLLGVTTAEAGVSRLVSVDVEEALGMVARQTAEA